MKKILQAIIIIFLLIVALIISLVTYSYFKAEQYNNSAVPYIKQKIPELSSWNPEVMKKYIAPDTSQKKTDEYLTILTLRLAELGQLKNFDEPQFVNIESIETLLDGKQTIATYNILTRYENGDANITIRLLEGDDGFKIYTFYVGSIAPIE
jgi:hypothetical protein